MIILGALLVLVVLGLIGATWEGIHSHASQRYAGTRTLHAYRFLPAAKFFRSFSWS